MKRSTRFFSIMLFLTLPLFIYSQISENILPEITLFETTESNGRVYIKWNITNDVHCDNMIIQRSMDALVWTNIHYVHPNGDYNSSKVYHYIDTEAQKGLIYYRLVMVKRGKPTQKSDVRVVKIDPKGTVKCFPNPSTGIVNFYIDSSEHTRGYLRIINGNGFVEHFEIIEIEEGASAFKRDFSHLDRGIYIVKIDFDSGLSFSQQEIIQD